MTHGETIAGLLADADALIEEPDSIHVVTIALPGNLSPHERHDRFTMHLDAELRLARLGSAGGGSVILALDDDGEWRSAYSLIDADATDLDPARALIREHLTELGCPTGTLIQHDGFEDRWDGERWHLGEDRSFDEELLDGRDE